MADNMTDTITELVHRNDSLQAAVRTQALYIAALLQKFSPKATVRIAQADFNKVEGMGVNIKGLKSAMELSLVKPDA